MKKLLIIALALFALQVTAQDKKENRKELRKEKMEHFKSMDPAEKAKLQTKRMTLALDLTQEQQDKVEKLNLKNAELRKAGMEKRMALKEANKKLSKDERLKASNAKLDHEIATKKEMEAILTKEQFEKYTKMSQKRQMKGKRGKMKHEKGEKKERKMKTE